MGKSVRKYRKSREYDYVAAPTPSAADARDGSGKGASAYAFMDARRISETPLFGHHYHPYSDDDLLTSPREFVPLAELAPGDCGSFHVLAVLVCACVGPTGAVVMPFAFLQGGFLLTIVLLVAFAAMTLLVSLWLMHLGVESGTYSLHGVATLSLGRRGALITGVLQLAASAGRVVAGFLLLFDDLRAMLARSLRFDFDAYGDPIEPPHSSSAVVRSLGNVLTYRVLFAELITLLLVVPFCLRSFYYRKLKMASTVSVVALLLATASAIASAKRLHHENGAASQGFHRDYITVPLQTFPQMLGILGACFGYQHHAFHAFYAMRERSVAEFARVSCFAMLVSLFVCYGVGIGGYVAFLKGTPTDVLERYDFGGNATNLAYWVAVPASAVVAIALEVVVSAHSVQFLTQSMRSSSVSDAKSSDDVLFRAQHSSRYGLLDDGLRASTSPTRATERPQDASRLPLSKNRAWKRYLITAVVLVATAQLAIFVDMNVAGVLTLTGGLASLLLLFVLPAACSFKLARNHRDSDSAASCREGVLAQGLLVFSMAIGVAASVACVVSYVVAGQ